MEEMANPHTIIGELIVQFRTAQQIIKRLQKENEELKKELGYGEPSTGKDSESPTE
jgi:hypothetical protein